MSRRSRRRLPAPGPLPRFCRECCCGSVPGHPEPILGDRIVLDAHDRWDTASRRRVWCSGSGRTDSLPGRSLEADGLVDARWPTFP